MTRRHLLCYLLPLLCISLLLSLPYLAATGSQFEGFDAEEEDISLDDDVAPLLPPPTITQSDFTDPDPNPNPIDEPIPESQPLDPPPKSVVLIEWDEDEFEGFPIEETLVSQNATPGHPGPKTDQDPRPEIGKAPKPRSYIIEIVSCSFLILFVVNYFVGKRENEAIALSWASRYATKGSILEKNFSLLGVGDGKDEGSPLLLKEGSNSFKFYASGRRYCQGMVAKMELKNRPDLISRVFNMIVARRDEITFEVYMNEEAMDHVVFALAKKKKAKAMIKDERDLGRFAGLVATSGGRKWVVEDLGVVSESKEVAGDLITEAVLEQVFGDKAFEKVGKYFISIHFSDQHLGKHRKVLVFKFALPNAKNVADMARLVALVPYYIDFIGRYKLSSQARAKTEAARQKVAQEMYREFQNARQEVLQKKKVERRKLIEEAEAKLSAEAIRKKDAKERARQMKKAMPKVKMSRTN